MPKSKVYPDDNEPDNPLDMRKVPPIPEHPTEAQPGTDDKIETMRRRAEKGERIFHPDDI